MDEIQLNIEKVEIVPEVRSLPPDMKIYMGTEVKDSNDEKILEKFNDIKIGTIVTVEDSFGNIRKAKCQSKTIKDRSTYAQDTEWEIASYSLEFDKDDRHCWVCTGTNHISKKLMKMWGKKLTNVVSCD